MTGAAACGGAAKLPVSAGMGPNPQLPVPRTSLLPVINVVDARGWSGAEAPQPATGLTVAAFARGLDHPRWLYVLPNGDVLVAETNAPPRPEAAKGLRGRITLLRDADNDGVAEGRWVFLSNLNSPFGMALHGDTLHVANTAAVVRVRYTAGQTQITAAPTTVVSLPAGPRNYHWTKNIVLSRDGSKLYVAVGSNSNVAEPGLGEEEGRAAIWEVEVATGAHRVYASGLRNPVGMAWEPATDTLWVAVNERDELGSDLVPDYALGPHTTSLGLAAAGRGTAMPDQFREGMFVGQHGSWNRKPHSGYKVIFIPFKDGKPSGNPVDVLTGFITDDGDAMGRPVGVAVDARGALLVADDVGNTIWRVARSTPPGSLTTHWRN